MPEFKDLFPKSFKARDFRDGPAVLTIESVEPRVLEGKNDSVSVKLCIKFKETNRFWFAGPKEACPSVAEALDSTDTDDWVGQRIELYEAETEFGDDIVDCVRARKPSEDAPPVEKTSAKKASKKKASRKAKKSSDFPKQVSTDEDGDPLVQAEEGGEIFAIEKSDLESFLAGTLEFE